MIVFNKRVQSFIGLPIDYEPRVSKSIAELGYHADGEWFGLDTETTGLDPHSDDIISVQIRRLGSDAQVTYVFDVRDNDTLDQLRPFLEKHKFVLHNAKFDYKMLKAAGITLGQLYDTQVAECLIYAGHKNIKYSLSALCERYCDIELVKDVRDSFIGLKDKPMTAEQVTYAAKDLEYLEDIKSQQESKIQQMGMKYCLELEMEVVKALGDIEFNGMGIDVSYWRHLAAKNASLMNDLTFELDNVVEGHEKLSNRFKPQYVQSDLFYDVLEQRTIIFNYASNAQVKEALHLLGFQVDSTDDKVLSTLIGKHPFIDLLCKHRELSKQLSTYGEAFLENVNPSTGRIHTDFWQVKSTGRLSSGRPNIQNIPADNVWRNAFVARPGFKWVSIDFSGQELAIMADLSGEKVFIDALNNKEDLHCISASLMFGRTITKADKKERAAAKTTTFALAYGAGPRKIAATLQIPVQEAEELLAGFTKSFPALMSWLDKAGRESKQSGASITEDICKRVRSFPDISLAKELRKSKDPSWSSIMKIEGATEREGKNHKIQGCGASITKEALVEVRQLIRVKYPNDAFMIAQVHDAIDVEVRAELAEQFAKEMGEIMKFCASKYVKKVKMDVDTTITDKWQK